MVRITQLLGATAFFSLYLMALGCEPGATQDTTADSLDYVEAELVMIDGTSTAGLEGTDVLIVDLTLPEMVYAIDLTDETLDTDRILIVEDVDEEFLLSELLEVEIPEQGYSKEEVERLVLTAEATNFGTLDPVELEELATVGTVVQETEIMTPAGEFGTMTGALKISLEIYWTSKKGKDRCIKISIGAKNADGGGSDVKPKRPEAELTKAKEAKAKKRAAKAAAKEEPKEDDAEKADAKKDAEAKEDSKKEDADAKEEAKGDDAEKAELKPATK